MEAMILQNGHRVVVFNDEARRRLAQANEAIRRVRQLGGLAAVSAVYIDAPRPLVLLRCAPPAPVLAAASGLHSKRLDDGRYQARCSAFGVDWGWIADVPATHVGTPAPAGGESQPGPRAAHPLFGGRVLRLVGDAA